MFFYDNYYFSGWLTGHRTPETESPPPPAPSEPMDCRFGLCDQQRNAMSVWLAPGNQLAAVSDNLGRIVLVDCTKGIALRIWKGYREAQCSFIEVTERSSKISKDQKQDRRHTLFIVIFAPRRSCLEIWPLQRGPKTAAFTASKFGQLLFNSYGLMGGTPGAKIKYNQNSCLFFDPTDQYIKEIVVPFHCALTDANSKTAKDLHLLRRLKLCLRCDNGTKEQVIEEVTTICCNIQTNDIRLLCLEMLIKNIKVKPKVLKAAINSLQDQALLEEMEEGNVEEEEQCEVEVAEKSDIELSPIIQRIQLLTLCRNYLKLVEFYLYVNDLNDPVEENEDVKKTEACASGSSHSSTKELITLSESELSNMQRLLDLLSIGKTTDIRGKVTFEEEMHLKNNPFIEFLSVFNTQNDDLILLYEDKSDMYHNIGTIVYETFLEQGKSFNRFIKEFVKSGILCEDFLKLLLFYWLEKPFVYTKRFVNLFTLLQILNFF